MAENGGCSGHCDSCGSCPSDESCKLNYVLDKIGKVIVVMSGKGGVGKSTVSVNLAMALALEGKRVGLLDVDFHGPSIPGMLNVKKVDLEGNGERMLPVEACGLKVMSLGFLIDEPDKAIVWRGPVKMGAIKQLISEVEWGELDYLVVDCPPGTGDEPLTVCQTVMGHPVAAVIVTTPQQVAAADVSRSIDFCKQLELEVLGIVENMSGFVCPHCNEITEIFSKGAGEELAQKYNLKFLGKVPIDPAVCASGDDGKPFVHFQGRTATGKAFIDIVNNMDV